MKKTISFPYLFLIFSLFFLYFFHYSYAAFPDYYYKIKNIQKQKKAFVNIILPLIKSENNKIIRLRKKIIKIFNDPYFIIKEKDTIFLSKIAKKYKIKNIFNEKEYLLKIDKIPPSLALAQAAIESGWGKSRFVKLGNNLFGHWEYSPNGIKPKSKYKNIDINYSLKIFPSLQDSISAYMLNLNRNPAYSQFRKKREKFRKEHKIFTGIDAAPTIKNYSQLKEKYVKRIIKLIKNNNWTKYDK